MIRSMTGFGRAESITKERKIVIEMKSVNHRYCDINIKMPKKFNSFEAVMRNHLKAYIGRGKIDIYISYEDYTKNNVCVKYNPEIAAEYVKYIRQMETDFDLRKNDLSAVILSKYPEVLTLEEISGDEERLWKEFVEVLDEAAEQFVESRMKEGENLKTDLLDKLKGMLEMVDYIEEVSPSLVDNYRKRIEDKVKELLENSTIDENRIAAEVTIYADKICVDEETVRLRSHIENTMAILTEGGNVGRKLDFIAQEMNREANTILSKADSLDISNKAIDLKTEIEKVREQIQNIE
ncbi:MAG: YicC family protein [Lachnospiraceae bacterium]|nr:YicC family protein [Lachnospiraceae bacterium]MDE6627313.1 YicC family protein [Lachnospiraceae bacterium]